SGDDIQDVRRRIDNNDLKSGSGEYRTHDIVPAYFERIVGDVKLARPMKIAVDCGNGVGGAFAPELYRRLSCDVIELYCDVDGTFPNHHPDPSQPKNLQDLIARVKSDRCQVGLDVDGDADRLGVITRAANFFSADGRLFLFAATSLCAMPARTVP